MSKRTEKEHQHAMMEEIEAKKARYALRSRITKVATTIVILIFLIFTVVNLFSGLFLSR